MRILLVSKNKKLTESIPQAIKLYLPDDKLTAAFNINESININQKQLIDIFIIDLDLLTDTEHDVFDLIKMIRSSSDTIIISLYSTNASMIKAFNFGSTQCILKPFDSLELIACIKSIVKKTTKKNNLVI